MTHWLLKWFCICPTSARFGTVGNGPLKNATVTEGLGEIFPE